MLDHSSEHHGDQRTVRESPLNETQNRENLEGKRERGEKFFVLVFFVQSSNTVACTNVFLSQHVAAASPVICVIHIEQIV